MTLHKPVEPLSSQASVVSLLHLLGNSLAPCRPTPVSVSEATRAPAAGDTFTLKVASVITRSPLDPLQALFPSSQGPSLPPSPGCQP